MHLMTHACFDPAFAGKAARSMQAFTETCIIESMAPKYLLQQYHVLNRTDPERNHRAEALDSVRRFCTLFSSFLPEIQAIISSLIVLKTS